MIVASGRSSAQIAGLAKKLQERLKGKGFSHIRLEGTDQCNWVILDAGDIVVHLFRPEVRDYYDIEKMWSHPQISDGVKPAIGPHAIA